MENTRNKRKRTSWFKGIIGRIASVVVLLLGFWSSAQAVIFIQEEDLALRWDNTIRYNYGVRMRSPQGCLLNSPNYDDGNRNFAKGTVTNRLDVLSEIGTISGMPIRWITIH